MRRLASALAASLALLTGCGTMPPLHKAAGRGDTAAVLSLLDKGTKVDSYYVVKGFGGESKRTALMEAIDNGRVETVKALLARGADRSGMSLLAAQQGQVEIVKVFLEAGEKIDDNLIWSSVWGWGPRNPELVTFLLDSGASLKACDSKGNGVLHTAISGISLFHVDTRMLNLLLKRGADPAAVNDDGETPLTIAERESAAHPQNEGLSAAAAILRRVTPKAVKPTESKVAAAAPGLGRDEVKRLMAETLREASEEKKAADEGARKASDVDKPGYSSVERSDALAVVIGVEKYSSLPAADFAERDAEAVRLHLMAMGYPPRNVYYLAGAQATRGKISQALNTWLPARATEGSTVFFYYSGHGAPDRRRAKLSSSRPTATRRTSTAPPTR